MNMAERAEDLDIEPDVLKFKKIWEEMNETTKPKQPLPRDNSHEASKNKSKIDAKTKDHSRKEKSKEPKKQTVVS